MPGDVTNTNNDPTDVQCTVGDIKPLREFGGVKKWKTYHEVSLNRGPGGRAYGFNRQKGNNGCTFEIHVQTTSPDLPALHDLVTSQKAVPIKAEVVDNLDLYQEGQEIGLGCEQGVLSGGERTIGSDNEAQMVVFEVQGIGPLVTRKGKTG